MVQEEIDYRTKTINKSIEEIREIKEHNPEYKLGYSVSPGGILNAYREGDIDFDTAVTAINKMIMNGGKK